MGRFLDLRISENSNQYNQAFAAVAVATTPSMVGNIGLQTQNIAGISNGTGLLVHLWGTVGVDASLINPVIASAATVFLNIVRGSTGFVTTGLIYTAAHVINLLATGPKLLSLTASDPNAPATTETIYSLHIHATGTGVSRVGPENFGGLAANNGVLPSPTTDV